MGQYVKVRLNSDPKGSWFVQPKYEPLDLDALFQDDFTGEENGYVISLLDMTDEKFKTLPDFDGF